MFVDVSAGTQHLEVAEVDAVHLAFPMSELDALRAALTDARAGRGNR